MYVSSNQVSPELSGIYDMVVHNSKRKECSLKFLATVVDRKAVKFVNYYFPSFLSWSTEKTWFGQVKLLEDNIVTARRKTSEAKENMISNCRRKNL